MKTSYRDDVLAKNRLLLKFALSWAVSTSIAVIVLAFLCFYTVKHKQIHWLPVCTSSEFSVSEGSYSVSYLKEMTERVADLRLTYNPETIDARYTTLSHLIPASHQEAFKKQLDSERRTVHEKNISSVFYVENVAVDVTTNQGQVEGLMYRTSHGLQIKPEHKTYRFQFSFKQGLLGLQSVQEIHNATR